MLPVCSVCGQENPEGARFCNSCGAPLGAEHEPAREEPFRLSASTLISSMRRASATKPLRTWTSCSSACRRSKAAVALPLAFVLSAVGRTDDFGRVASSAPISTGWLEAASAFAAGQFDDAAGVLEEMGAVADEAILRLRAAETLAAQGRRAEADGHLQRALAFYRSVGATAYIREAEAPFAATA